MKTLLAPLTDDDAVYAPLPRRLEYRDEYLEPVGLRTLRGIALGVALGMCIWAVVFIAIYLMEIM